MEYNEHKSLPKTIRCRWNLKPRFLSNGTISNPQGYCRERTSSDSLSIICGY